MTKTMRSNLAKIKYVASRSYKLALESAQADSRVLAGMLSDLAHNTEQALLELDKDRPLAAVLVAA